jgi:hypothetical protein
MQRGMNEAHDNVQILSYGWVTCPWFGQSLTGPKIPKSTQLKPFNVDCQSASRSRKELNCQAGATAKHFSSLVKSFILNNLCMQHRPLQVSNGGFSNRFEFQLGFFVSAFLLLISFGLKP